MIELYCKNKKHPKELDKKKMKKVRARYSGSNVEFLNQRGVPEQCGIYFAMGGALILQGILSACYHVCPIDESFQFDTTFMYIITVLIFLKIYQFRHPDTTTNAYITFSFIAVMLILEAVSYYSPPGVYIFVFVVTYLVLICSVIVDTYFQNNFKLGMRVIWDSIAGRRSPDKETSQDIGEKETSRKLKTGGKRRMVFFMMMGIMNICLATYFLYHMWKANDSIVQLVHHGASSDILLIFCANMVGYAVNYAIMKCYYVTHLKRSSESITWTCWIYIILATIFGGIGLTFFIKFQEKITNISPSESRHVNADCILWFFDTHDIWHFASAFTLLFTFMALLTLEDNNTSTSWKDIPVF